MQKMDAGERQETNAGVAAFEGAGFFTEA